MRLWADNAAATITDSPLSAGATTMHLATGKGALYPSPTGGDYFVGTLTQPGTETSWEEVIVTGRSSDTLTLQSGTVNSWPAGSKFELRLTADWLTNRELDQVYNTISPGSVAFVGKNPWYPPRNITMRDFLAATGAAPSVQPVLLTVRKNGVAVLSNVSIGVGANTSALTVLTTQFTPTDYMTIDLAQGDPTAGDVTVRMRYF